MDPDPLPYANPHGSNVAGRAGTRRAESTLEETHGEPPKLFSSIESTATKGSKIDWPTAMSAKLVTGENGFVLPDPAQRGGLTGGWLAYSAIHGRALRRQILSRSPATSA